MSFVDFLKKKLAYIQLGIVSRLQYRFNLFTGVVVHPILVFAVESAFWLGLFHASGQTLLGGFTQAQYLTYLLWLMLQIGGANWRLERLVIDDINSGAVNALLIRPTSFYEFHLGQLLGYKMLITAMSLPVVIGLALWWELPLYFDRLLPAIVMGFCYLIMIYTLNFAIASMAFFFDYVYSLNTTKNMIVWFLAGELFPLDLLPEPWRDWLIALPFSCGAFLPAGYISGRISTEIFLRGFVSLAIGMVCFSLIARYIWRLGLRNYSGTGA